MRREDAAPVAAAVVELASALRVWATREDSVPQPEVVGAGVRAVAAIDTALAELYLLRGRLVREQLANERAAIARLDALLERNSARRASRIGGSW